VFAKNGTLYIGVTGNLDRRVKNHKAGLVRGFTQKYSVCHLVYFETFESITVAIHREKQLKNWKRVWKINLIEKIKSECSRCKPWIPARRPERRMCYDSHSKNCFQIIELALNNIPLEIIARKNLCLVL